METPIVPAIGTLIKSHRSGRTRCSARDKRKVLDAFESSSLQRPWCERR